MLVKIAPDLDAGAMDSIAAVMLYVCMVLISKRHWAGREDGESRGGHYLLRTLCLLVVVGALGGWILGAYLLSGQALVIGIIASIVILVGCFLL